MVYSKLNIRIVPIGNLEEKFVIDFRDEFQKALHDAVGLDVKCFFEFVNPDSASKDRIIINKIPSTAYNPSIGKYNTHSLFSVGMQRKEDALKRLTSKDLLKVLLLIDFDIYRAGYDGILFGEAEQGGDIAIVSTAALKNKLKDESVIKDRSIKEALHVFGYLLGLEPCNSEGCAMSVAKDPKDIDKRNRAYCKDCMGKLYGG